MTDCTRQLLWRSSTAVEILVCIMLSTLPVARRCAAQPILESFETGLGGWTPQAFISNSIPWDWSVTRSQAQSSDGNWSLDFTASGVHDEGTVWIERSLELPAGSWALEVQFDFWSENSANLGTWEKVAFAGGFDPEVRDHFTVVGLEDVAGWKTYSLSETVRLTAPGRVWFAVGFAIIFETPTRTHYFDSVQISSAPVSGVRHLAWSAVKALYD